MLLAKLTIVYYVKQFDVLYIKKSLKTFRIKIIEIYNVFHVQILQILTVHQIVDDQLTVYLKIVISIYLIIVISYSMLYLFQVLIDVFLTVMFLYVLFPIKYNICILFVINLFLNNLQ